MRILIAADGSAYTQLAAKHVAEHVDWFAQTPEIHVVHVEPLMPYPGAQRVVGKAAVLAYEQAESEAALAVAQAELDKAQLPYKTAWRVGDVASELGQYVRENAIDLLVMGSRGKGAVASLALGSVTQKCIASLEVPVLIVRPPLRTQAAESLRHAVA